MTHHSRDQRKAAEFKREMHEALDDDAAEHINELLAAEHQRDTDQMYRGEAQPAERRQEGTRS